MEQTTIYPDKPLLEKLEMGAKEQRRSLNNFILFILNSYFEKKNG